MICISNYIDELDGTYGSPGIFLPILFTEVANIEAYVGKTYNVK